MVESINGEKEKLRVLEVRAKEEELKFNGIV